LYCYFRLLFSTAQVWRGFGILTPGRINNDNEQWLIAGVGLGGLPPGPGDFKWLAQLGQVFGVESKSADR
jgi:hypothetical protein